MTIRVYLFFNVARLVRTRSGVEDSHRFSSSSSPARRCVGARRSHIVGYALSRSMKADDVGKDVSWIRTASQSAKKVRSADTRVKNKMIGTLTRKTLIKDCMPCPCCPYCPCASGVIVHRQAAGDPLVSTTPAGLFPQHNKKRCT